MKEEKELVLVRRAKNKTGVVEDIEKIAGHCTRHGILVNTVEVKVAENATRNLRLVPVKSGFGDYLGHPSYYHIATGKSDDLSWHYLEIYVQHNIDEYYTLTAKIYGSEFVNERICSSFSLFNNITFLN